MQFELVRYLEDLEQRMDLEVEDDLDNQWRAFYEHRCPSNVFFPQRKRKSPSALTWPKIPINSALEDYEAMMLKELCGVNAMLATGNGALPNIRTNYGTGILPTVFGCEIFVMPEHMDTLPTAIKLPGGEEDIRRIVEQGEPHPDSGWWTRVFECGAFFRQHLATYPKLQSVLRIYHPDIQGPIDACELIWGSEMLLAFYDEPELLKQFLSVITDAYISFLQRWNRENPMNPKRPLSHWGFGLQGTVALRNDSSMNISGEMYEEFVMPFDQKILTTFGGGMVHFCGRGDQYIEPLSRVQGLTAVQMSQPHLNHMETIYRYTVDKGIPLLGFNRNTIPENRDMHHLMQCW